MDVCLSTSKGGLLLEQADEQRSRSKPLQPARTVQPEHAEQEDKRAAKGMKPVLASGGEKPFQSTLQHL